MFARIALFELRYQARRPIALISFLVFAVLAFGLAAASGVDPSVPVNAPGRVAIAFCLLSIVAMFLSLATPADVALRDGKTRMDAILRAQPVRTSVHFGARFAGAYAVACLTFLGAAIGYAIGAVMPWIPEGAAGPFQPAVYALAVMVIALPTLFATSASFFAIATLTRSLMATYLSALMLLMLVIAAPFLLTIPEYRTLGALLDPFGLFAFMIDTVNWTAIERSTRPIPLDGLLLWNRLVWMGIGGLLLALSFALFNARERRPRAPRVDLAKAASSPVMRERPIIAAGGVDIWDQFAVRTRHETRAILRSWTFRTLLVLGTMLAVGVLLAQALGGTPAPLAPNVVVQTIAGLFMLITMLVPIAYAGEIIWRDRKAKIAAIIDATPTPTAVFFLSKIVAVALVIVALLAVALITGIVFQLANGSGIEIGSYLTALPLEVGFPALMYGVLAILIQTVVNRKFVALLLMLAVLAFVGFASELGIESKLLVPFTIPEVPLSEINLQFFVVRALWFAGYWTCVATLMAIAAYLLWVRGAGSLWTRIRRARLAVTPAVALIAGIALTGAAATAGYIHWTSHGSMISVAPASEPLQVDGERAAPHVLGSR